MKNKQDLKWLDEIKQIGERIRKISDAYAFSQNDELSKLDVGDINAKLRRFSDLLFRMQRISEFCECGKSGVCGDCENCCENGGDCGCDKNCDCGEIYAKNSVCKSDTKCGEFQHTQAQNLEAVIYAQDGNLVDEMLKNNLVLEGLK